MNPVHTCAQDYWNQLVGHHERIGSGWCPPTWRDCTDEVKTVTLLRIHEHIISMYEIPEHIEHHEWILLKRIAGWVQGDYNRTKKSHPMLIPFEHCPRWFQDITGIFCGTVRQYKPEIIRYLQQGMP